MNGVHIKKIRHFAVFHGQAGRGAEIALSSAGDGICGLRTGAVQDQVKRARFVGPLVAFQRCAHSEPCFRRDGHCIGLRLYPLRTTLAAAPADCPRHFLQGGILFLVAHAAPRSADAGGCCDLLHSQFLSGSQACPMCGREVPPAFFSYATINRRLVMDLVKCSASSGMAFLNAVLSNRLLVTVFQVIL